MNNLSVCAGCAGTGKNRSRKLYGTVFGETHPDDEPEECPVCSGDGIISKSDPLSDEARAIWQAKKDAKKEKRNRVKKALPDG